MIFEPQVLLGGLFLGALYGLSAMGFQLIMATTGQVCLAYGHIWAVAALLVSSLLSKTGLALPVVFLLLPTAGFLAGWALQPAGIWNRPDSPARSRAFFLVTLGLALIIEDLGTRLWPLPATAFAWAPAPWQLGRLALPPLKVVGLLTVFALAALFSTGLRQRRWGYALRAWDFGRGHLWLAGVDPRLLGRLVLGFGFAIAGIAGCFLALSYTIAIQEGLALTLKCLVIAVLAGGLSPLRVLLIGAGMGLGEACVAHWFGTQWSPALGYLLLMVLMPLQRRAGA